MIPSLVDSKMNFFGLKNERIVENLLYSLLLCIVSYKRNISIKKKLVL